jgi:hypothetical protein
MERRSLSAPSRLSQLAFEDRTAGDGADLSLAEFNGSIQIRGRGAYIPIQESLGVSPEPKTICPIEHYWMEFGNWPE